MRINKPVPPKDKNAGTLSNRMFDSFKSLTEITPKKLQPLREAAPARPDLLTPAAQDFFATEAGLQPQETRAFYVRFLTIASLPHKNPGNIKAWERRAGPFTIILQPGLEPNEEWKKQAKQDPTTRFGYPYGIIPRYLMAFVATQVARGLGPDIELGRSLTKALQNVGMSGGGTSVENFTKQLWRLFSSRFFAYATVDSAGADGKAERMTTLDIVTLADSIKLWTKLSTDKIGLPFWDHSWQEETDLKRGVITLSKPFFDELRNHPVPFDPTTLKAIQATTNGTRHTQRGSSFLMDLYFWLNYRCFYLEKPLRIPWDALQMQFGTTYSRERDFKAFFLDSLTTVLRFYTDARITLYKYGIVLLPNRPALARPRARLPF